MTEEDDECSTSHFSTENDAIDNVVKWQCENRGRVGPKNFPDYLRFKQNKSAFGQRLSCVIQSQPGQPVDADRGDASVARAARLVYQYIGLLQCQPRFQ